MSEEARTARRLAAIIAAHVVGYSRLMGIDEEGTLAALKSHRQELIDPLIAQHQGRIVKTTGDGLLIEFASIVDAVRCAVVMQEDIKDRFGPLRRDGSRPSRMSAFPQLPPKAARPFPAQASPMTDAHAPLFGLCFLGPPRHTSSAK